MAKKQEEAATGLLMPKATAVWLVENTGMTFEQIGEFTNLHAIEVQALADEEVGRGIAGRDPLKHGELTQEELDNGNADPFHKMVMAKSALPPVKTRAKGPRYTPVSKRGDKPDAISYLLKHHPEITDAQIVKLIGTTKPTINAVRGRTHANSSSIRPRHPVDLGLCTYAELEKASDKGLKAQGKDPDEIKAHKERILENQERDRAPAPDTSAGFDFSNFLEKSSDTGQ